MCYILVMMFCCRFNYFSVQVIAKFGTAMLPSGTGKMTLKKTFFLKEKMLLERRSCGVHPAHIYNTISRGSIRTFHDFMQLFLPIWSFPPIFLTMQYNFDDL